MPSLTPAGKTRINTVVVVGCGGVASYLLPCLLRTFKIDNLILFDGDTLEPRNLDRQLFTSAQIGMNKAEALSKLLVGFTDTVIEVVPEYFHDGSVIPAFSLIIACVDNHTARKNVLRVADTQDCNVVIAANEYTDSQAIFYSPEWSETGRDPRVRYPEILTDHSEDPMRPSSCQGELQRTHSQLAMANFGAANHALWLIWFWYVERDDLDADTLAACAPIEHTNNFSRFRTVPMAAVDEKQEVAA